MLFFLTNLSFLDRLREANLPGFFCPSIRVRVISMPWKINGSTFVIKTSQMTWFCGVFTTIKPYFLFLDQIDFHEFVLLLFLYIMHAQSHIVYKLMTVIIVLVPVIKDVKIVQLYVLLVYFFLNIFCHQ